MEGMYSRRKTTVSTKPPIIFHNYPQYFRITANTLNPLVSSLDRRGNPTAKKGKTGGFSSVCPLTMLGEVKTNVLLVF